MGANDKSERMRAAVFYARENFDDGGNGKEREGGKCSLIKRVQIALSSTLFSLCSTLKLFYDDATRREKKEIILNQRRFQPRHPIAINDICSLFDKRSAVIKPGYARSIGRTMDRINGTGRYIRTRHAPSIWHREAKLQPVICLFGRCIHMADNS